MSADHLSAVAAIERSVFPDPWTEASFLEAMSFSDKCWVALKNNNVVGYAVTQWVMDEIHILNIAVSQNNQRKGIGKVLLARVLDSGFRAGMQDVFLEVRISNLAAQALYGKFGFSVLATRRRYYRDGEDALVMHTVLERAEADLKMANLLDENKDMMR